MTESKRGTDLLNGFDLIVCEFLDTMYVSFDIIYLVDKLCSPLR